MLIFKGELNAFIVLKNQILSVILWRDIKDVKLRG